MVSVKADTSMFVHTSTSDIIVLLLYVDDILITGSDVAGIPLLINSLSRCFEMKVTKVLHPGYGGLAFT